MGLEKDHLQKALATAFDEFIDVFASFDEDSINRRLYPDSWTPAQVASHIILATDGVPDSANKPLDREIDLYLPAIRPWWEDLSQKFKSPESLQPDDKQRSKNEVLAELKRVREKDLKIVAQEDLTRICLDFELPTIGYLTRYEWLWFIEMHLKRHLFQLQNMR
jgi:DinB superfamily